MEQHRLCAICNKGPVPSGCVINHNYVHPKCWTNASDEQRGTLMARTQQAPVRLSTATLISLEFTSDNRRRIARDLNLPRHDVSDTEIKLWIQRLVEHRLRLLQDGKEYTHNV